LKFDIRQKRVQTDKVIKRPLLIVIRVSTFYISVYQLYSTAETRSNHESFIDNQILFTTSQKTVKYRLWTAFTSISQTVNKSVTILNECSIILYSAILNLKYLHCGHECDHFGLDYTTVKWPQERMW